MPLRDNFTTGVNFSKTTPVSIQMKKKPKKNTTGIPHTNQESMKQRRGNPKKSPVMAKRKPFIPPPGRTSPSKQMAWESKSHRLEINQPTSASRSLRVNDLSSSSSEDEPVVAPTSARKFERNIDKLLQDEEGTSQNVDVKNQVSLSERRYVAERAEEQLNASRRLIEDQEHELKAYKNDLTATARDYSKLRRSFDMVNKEVVRSKTEAEMLETEKDTLQAKLVAIEREGRDASREMEKLRDSCRKLKQDKKMTLADVETLSRQRDMLLERLDQFEVTNKDLRKLLKDAHRRQELQQSTADRCEILMRKLTEAEAKIQDQSMQLVEQDKQIDTLIQQVDADKYQAKSFVEVKNTLESTRAHLQKELRSKEGDNNRLAVQCQKLEGEINAQSLELEHLQGLLSATREKTTKDKDALKKATRIQRERAQQQEDVNEDMQKQINSLLAELDNSKLSLQEITDVHVKLKHDYDFIEDETKILRRNIFELGNILEFSPKTMKAGVTHVVEKLVTKVRLLKEVKQENQTLKNEIRTLDDKLFTQEKKSSEKIRSLEDENTKLRSAIEQYEGLTAEYKTQLERHRSDNEELRERMKQQHDDMQTKMYASSIEANEVKISLQNKISELEVYPELLKAAEVRLQDSTARTDKAERKIDDHTKLIAELTQKVELQTEQLDNLREKYRKRSEENKNLEQQLHNFERKKELHKTLTSKIRRTMESDSSHREMILSINRKDEQLLAMQSQINDQRIENERLINQLEIALSDAKKQTESQKEKSHAKERSAQARIMDLENQLSRSTQNTQLLKRSKEEAERKFNSRLQDMRDRLEQANSTTRSMQNYVQFLKSTYANVFSDDGDSDHKLNPMPF